MRKTLLPTALAAALGAAASGTAGAQQTESAMEFGSARDLMRACESTSGYRLGLCHGFIVGNGALYDDLRRARDITPWACADPAPNVDTIRTHYVSWARSHNADLGQSAVDGFWRAMAASYPC